MPAIAESNMANPILVAIQKLRSDISQNIVHSVIIETDDHLDIDIMDRYALQQFFYEEE